MKKQFAKYLVMALVVAMAFAVAGVSVAPVAEAAVENESQEAISYEETVAYDGTGNTFEEIVETALAGGKNTIIELRADVTYTDAERTIHHIGEAYADTEVPANTIKVTSGTNVDGSGNPYGFVFSSYNTILNMYGNYVFDDIKLDLKANWTKGGVIQVTKGSLTVGHPNEAAEGEEADYGNVYMPSLASLTGQNLKVYTGGNDGYLYTVIGANFYNVGLTVENPVIELCGDAKADVLIGGLLAYNSNSPTAIVGKANLKLSDAACANWLGVTRDATQVNEYGADVVIDTTGTVGSIELIGRMSGRYDTKNHSSITIDQYPLYNLTINNVNVSSKVCMGQIRTGNPRISFNVDINGGTFNGPVYLGYVGEEGKVDNAYNIKGNMTATLNDATFKNAFFCGSYLADNTSVWNSNEQIGRNVTITDCTFTTVTNVSYSGMIYGGSYIVDDNVLIGNSKTDEGALTLTINGDTSCKNIYGGSLFASKNSDYTPRHKAPISITINDINCTSHIYGASNLGVAGANHTGNSTLTIKGGTYGGRFFAGSNIAKANAEHSGKSTLVLDGNFESVAGAYFIGGSLISNGTHSGDSAIEVKATTLTAHSGFFAGSWCDGDSTAHTGSSTLYVGKGGSLSGWNSAKFAGSFLNNSNTKHLGDSTLIIEADGNIGSGTFITGSKLTNRGNLVRYVGTSEKPVKMTATINCASNDVVVNGSVFAGCEISASESVIYADSTLNIKKGTLVAEHGAGCYSSVEWPDSTPDNGITGDFAQVGDITYTLEDGIVSGAFYTSGHGVNVDGDVKVNISGGTITSMFYATSSSKNYPSAISGDLIVKVTGGTFNNDICIGGAYTGNSYKTDGKNVIGGNVYSEFIDDGKGADVVFNFTAATNRTHIRLEPAGEGLVVGDTYIKFVGDIPMYDAANDNAQLFGFNYGICAQSSDNAYLDLLQYTSTTELPSWSYFDVTIYPLNNADVTLQSTNVVSGTAVSDLIATLTFGGATYTYADLTSFDGYTDYDNALKVYSSTNADAPITTIGALTEGIIIKVPSANETVVSSNVITLNNENSNEKAAYENNVSVNYEGKAFSMRTRKDGAISYGLRYRARISKEFIDTYTTTEFFKVKEIGIKVSASINGTPWSHNAVAWQNGNNIEWMTDEQNDAGYYLFAAVITGFNDDVARYAQEFTFEVYLTYEDASGETVTLWIGAPQTNSLKGVATSLSTLPEYEEWYTTYKDEIDAIVNS